MSSSNVFTQLTPKSLENTNLHLARSHVPPPPPKWLHTHFRTNKIQTPTANNTSKRPPQKVNLKEPSHTRSRTPQPNSIDEEKKSLKYSIAHVSFLFFLIAPL